MILYQAENQGQFILLLSKFLKHSAESELPWDVKHCAMTTLLQHFPSKKKDHQNPYLYPFNQSKSL
jgi:hypothetical protein